MTLQWTPEHIATLAPDSSSLKNGRALAIAKQWLTLGQTNGILWGEIKGSGSKPYQTCIEQTTPTFKCSCPSRKFPCKHGLGLALIASTQSDTLLQATKPDWVAEWLDKREQRAQRQSKPNSDKELDAETLKKREQAQQKRRAAHDNKVSTGVAELQTWLYDQVRQGLSQSIDNHRLWDTMAARLIDAQAPGLAKRLQACAALRFASTSWQEKLLQEVARLHLLLTAYQRRESLSADLQADIAQQIGATTSKIELLEQVGLQDDWYVIGQAIEEQDGLRIQRTWLQGLQQSRYALLLDFAAAQQPMTLRPSVGSCFKAELVFYPNTWPVRALVKQEDNVSNNALPLPDSAFISIANALTNFQRQLVQSPWLTQYAFALANVIPIRHATEWLLVDAELNQITLKITEQQGWRLLALSGGQTLNIFGEWDGEQLLPLTAFVNHPLKTIERL